MLVERRKVIPRYATDSVEGPENSFTILIRGKTAPDVSLGIESYLKFYPKKLFGTSFGEMSYGTPPGVAYDSRYVAYVKGTRAAGENVDGPPRR